MSKKIKILITLLTVLSWLPVQAQPVVAAMSDPISVSTYDMAVYQHLLEDDDRLFIIPYSINYASTQNVTIDDAFLFQMYDPTGTNLLGTSLAYPYQDAGYGPGIVSFYFPASDNLTWQATNIIRIVENPSQFATPTYWDFPLAVSDYTSATTQATNQEALRLKILGLATDLSISWSLDLLAQTEMGTVLSSYGEDYFRNSILSLQSMCPGLFSVQMAVPDFDTTSWDYTVANTFLSRYNGTFIGDAMTGFAGLTSSDTTTAMNVWTLILFGALVCFEMSWTRKKNVRGYRISSKPFAATVWSAMMDGSALLILMTLLGAFSMVLNGLISFLCVVVLGMVLFLNRA